MTSCGCIYVGGFDGPDEERSYDINKRAVKPIRCGECGGAIKPLQKYEFTHNEYYGTASEHITCKDCVSVRDEFFCDGWIYGEIWERVHSHIFDMDGQISSKCIDALTQRAKRMFIGAMDEVFEELNENDECEECFHCIHAQRTEFPDVVHCILYLEPMFPWQSCQWWKPNDAY